MVKPIVFTERVVRDPLRDQIIPRLACWANGSRRFCSVKSARRIVAGAGGDERYFQYIGRAACVDHLVQS
ncbi:MAG: hypothetical protein FJ387_30105 [Verrucomicrobia bacterium]|nr:hypothetical protein [Verrucomicrobiota bacterium]